MLGMTLNHSEPQVPFEDGGVGSIVNNMALLSIHCNQVYKIPSLR